MRAIEKALAVLDRVLAFVITLAAFVTGAMGLMLGLLGHSQKAPLAGHGFTLALAATLWVVGWLCGAAGRAMRDGGRARWLLQLAPVVGWVVGFTLTLCISGTPVLLYGDTAICGR